MSFSSIVYTYVIFMFKNHEKKQNDQDHLKILYQRTKKMQIEDANNNYIIY